MASAQDNEKTKKSVILDVKPWDDETDLAEMERLVRSVELDGLAWGGPGKLVPLAFGIQKLQIACVIDGNKMSVDDLIEMITEQFEDHVQSVELYCRQAKCGLKSDSDTVANLPAIEKLCRQRQSESSSILGNCGVNNPDRNPSSKWYTPVWVWSKNYPEFCLGSAYLLIGSNTSTQLVNSMNETAFVRSGNFRKMGEDVVWTGIVAEKTLINRIRIIGFSPQRNSIYHCFEDGQKSALTVHYIKGIAKMTKQWRIMQRPRQCLKTVVH